MFWVLLSKCTSVLPYVGIQALLCKEKKQTNPQNRNKKTHLQNPHPTTKKNTPPKKTTKKSNPQKTPKPKLTPPNSKTQG